MPFGRMADGPGQDGTELVLAGPRHLRLRGYYCVDAYCAVDGRESLELWVMPSRFREAETMPAIMAMRSSARIFDGRGVRVYALVSRRLPDGADFDRAFTGASDEDPPLPDGSGGELPLSWTGWRPDLTRALAR